MKDLVDEGDEYDGFILPQLAIEVLLEVLRVVLLDL